MEFGRSWPRVTRSAALTAWVWHCTNWRQGCRLGPYFFFSVALSGKFQFQGSRGQTRHPFLFLAIRGMTHERTKATSGACHSAQSCSSPPGPRNSLSRIRTLTTAVGFNSATAHGAFAGLNSPCSAAQTQSSLRPWIRNPDSKSPGLANSRVPSRI
jgi:hypothetical protein